MGQQESRTPATANNKSATGVEFALDGSSATATGNNRTNKTPMKMNSKANLKSELDNVSTGSADSGTHHEDLDFVQALEYGEDSGAHGGAGGDGSKSPLSEEDKAKLQQELMKVEDEISTLRQVLTARLKYSNELKRKLGLTPWAEVQQDLNQGIKTVKETQAFQRTADALHQSQEAVSKKLGQIRSSNTFKSFEEKVGSAYNNVKAKIAASTSIDQLSGGGGGGASGGQGQRKQSGSAAATQPTTPSSDNNTSTLP